MIGQWLWKSGRLYGNAGTCRMMAGEASVDPM